MLLLLDRPDFTCTCGARFDTRGDADAHVQTGRCPRQAPDNPRAAMTWARTTGKAWLHRPRTVHEAERREQALERARHLKDNPEYAANSAAKREAERLARERARALKTQAATTATTEEETVIKTKKKPARKARAQKPDRQAKIRTRMAKEVREHAAKKGQPAPFTAPAGTRIGQLLVREYHGKMVEAEITKDGIVFRGKTYRSLGSIADEVCGHHVSGPAFFGLWTPPSSKKGKGPGTPEPEVTAADLPSTGL